MCIAHSTATWQPAKILKEPPPTGIACLGPRPFLTPSRVLLKICGTLGLHEITFYLICYSLKVVVRLVPMELLAAMAYLSSPSPRLITIIWVPVHTKPALGPVEGAAPDEASSDP